MVTQRPEFRCPETARIFSLNSGRSNWLSPKLYQVRISLGQNLDQRHVTGAPIRVPTITISNINDLYSLHHRAWMHETSRLPQRDVNAFLCWYFWKTNNFQGLSTRYRLHNLCYYSQHHKLTIEHGCRKLTLVVSVDSTPTRRELLREPGLNPPHDFQYRLCGRIRAHSGGSVQCHAG